MKNALIAFGVAAVLAVVGWLVYVNIFGAAYKQPVYTIKICRNETCGQIDQVELRCIATTDGGSGSECSLNFLVGK